MTQAPILEYFVKIEITSFERGAPREEVLIEIKIDGWFNRRFTGSFDGGECSTAL